MDDAFEDLLWDFENDWLPEALMEFDRKVFRPELDYMVETEGCSISDDGNVSGYLVRGQHVLDDTLRMLVAYEIGENHREFDDHTVRRCYGRLVPYSLMYPNEPPCESGEEANVWEFTDTPKPYSERVTVMDLY